MSTFSPKLGHAAVKPAQVMGRDGRKLRTHATAEVQCSGKVNFPNLSLPKASSGIQSQCASSYFLSFLPCLSCS